MMNSISVKAKRLAQKALNKFVASVTPHLDSSTDELTLQQQDRRQGIGQHQRLYQRPTLQINTENPTPTQDPDLELGEQRSAEHHPESESQSRQFGDVIRKTNDKLLVYRSLTGIDNVPALLRAGFVMRAAPNLGIYTRVILSENRAHKRYQTYHRLVNLCLAVQIIVGALLTALGASDGTNGAVTAFGTINTMVAAVLTFLKGSGLPDKFRASKEDWKEVREYIEQREREFCLEGCALVVDDEVAIIEEMYCRVGSASDQLRTRGTRNCDNQGGPDDQQHQYRHQRLFPLQHKSVETPRDSPSHTVRLSPGTSIPPEVKVQAKEEQGEERQLEGGQISLMPPPPIVLSHSDHGCPHVCEDCDKPKTD